MKNFKKLALSLVALVVAVSAYAAEPSELYGKWVQNVSEGTVTAVTIYDFKSDGTMTQDLSIVNASNPKMEITGTAKSNYTFNKNTITFKFKPSDIDITKCEIEGIDPGLIQMVIEQQKAEMSKQEDKISDVKINGNVLTGKIKRPNGTGKLVTEEIQLIKVN